MGQAGDGNRDTGRPSDDVRQVDLIAGEAAGPASRKTARQLRRIIALKVEASAPPEPRYLWQTLSSAMQELPHGLLFAGLQFGCFGSGVLLRQDDMKFCRAAPLIPDA